LLVNYLFNEQAKDAAYSYLFPEVITSALWKFQLPVLQGDAMASDQVTNDRLSRLLAQLKSLTESGELHWERQLGSAHRYARWNNNLLILGPADPLSDTKVVRYLFVTPFNSPSCIEINSNDEEFGGALMSLVAAVEKASQHEPPTDPFGISEEELNRITG
jgi:hypothetical protein